jgi:hypothetical protein
MLLLDSHNGLHKFLMVVACLMLVLAAEVVPPVALVLCIVDVIVLTCLYQKQVRDASKFPSDLKIKHISSIYLNEH